MGRRDEVVDAAVEVLGTAGLRGLTHRAVDSAAGVPFGTASNCFRSRSALVNGIVERMLEQDLAFWSGFDVESTSVADGDLVLAQLAGYVRWSVQEGRVRSVARLNLFAAAAVESEVSESLRCGRVTVQRMAEVIGESIGLGAIESALVMEVCDAMIVGQIAMPVADFDPLPALSVLLARLR